MKVSSSSSTSSTSSLGNTDLQGFGGLVSGIDRDSLIEQMTSETSTKITKQKQEITKAEWKQEAYRNISDQVLNLEDEYLTFSSGTALKDKSLYAKSTLTATGNEDSAKLIKASGISDLTDNISISAVTKLATSATLVSGAKGSTASITSGDLRGNVTTATITPGSSSISFGIYDSTNSKFNTKATFTFPTSYKETVDGKETTKSIDYTIKDKGELVSEINKALDQNPVSLGSNLTLKFQYDSTNDKVSMQVLEKTGSETKDVTASATYQIKASDSVLTAMGIDTDVLKKADATKNYSTEGFSFSAYNSNIADSTNTAKFSNTIQKEQKFADYIAGKNLTFTYSGSSKSISLSGTELGTIDASASTDETLQKIAGLYQSKLDDAFGSGKVTASYDSSTGAISFSTVSNTETLSISSSDSEFLKNMGITNQASTRVNQSSSIWENREKLGFSSDITEEELNKQLSDFTINGKQISGITASTTVSSMLYKINQSDAGVKATYMSGSNQFALIATRTGSGRQIKLGDGAESTIFGTTATETGGASGVSQDGQDAELVYNYGNGINQTVHSSTNTFQIDGLSITASGTFGTVTGSDGTVSIDSSKAVRFTASADVDKVTESVKKFIDSFNKIVTDVNAQVRTRPTSGYDPLTEAQEKEMSESEITKWNEKAKAGILYSSDVIRDFSDSLQSVFNKMIESGISYNDMKKIGISMSDDYTDGGKITFDETKFKDALQNDNETVQKVMAGSGSSVGLAKTVENLLTPYATRFATRNGNSYGKLIEEAGSDKLVLTKENNTIYRNIEEMNEKVTSLKSLLKTEQDRYIKQFTSMETSINEMNNQYAYLSGITG
ncbi:MAG: flagellar filament capping protein FliD [Eubacterium sp.]|nr:flagellar filament capping protein FliD [Eubacterium sp.]